MTTVSGPDQHTDTPPGTGISRRTGGWLVALFLGIVAAALMSLVHLPYAVLKPGPVSNTLGSTSDGKPLISVQGNGTYPTTGALDFTTVAVFGGPANPVNVWDVLGGWLDPNSVVLPEEAIFPKGQTSKQIEQDNAAEMADSQQEAIAVALRSLGQKVTEHVAIAQVQPGSSAASVLRPGDVLVSVDGVPASDAAAIRAAIQKHKPGETVRLVVRRDGKELTVTPSTRSANGTTVLGVVLRTGFDFPVKVTINAGDVGGPSAGLMFSLGIYDKLSPGALTGGAKIAGTGTIDSSGAVGPIGGIQQKMAGARDGGATWFLAPASNCDEVVGHIPDGMRVVRVSTFTQARDAVEAIAARQTSGLAQCTAAPHAGGARPR